MKIEVMAEFAPDAVVALHQALARVYGPNLEGVGIDENSNGLLELTVAVEQGRIRADRCNVAIFRPLKKLPP